LDLSDAGGLFEASTFSVCQLLSIVLSNSADAVVRDVTATLVLASPFQASGMNGHQQTVSEQIPIEISVFLQLQHLGPNGRTHFPHFEQYTPFPFTPHMGHVKPR
jgi:hypothetical protein